MSDPASKVGLLRSIPLFRTLTLENLYDIATKVTEKEFNDHQIIFNAGDEGDALYIIQSGNVSILDQNEFGEEIILAELGIGNYFGEMALLTGETRSATVRSSSKTSLLFFSKENFQRLLSKNAALYIPIAYVLSQRLKEGNIKRFTEEVERKQLYTPVGDLADNSVIDVLKYCEENALTGSVHIKSANDKYHLDYKRGEILQIRLNELNTEDLLDPILSLKSGVFKIEPKPFTFSYESAKEEDVAPKIISNFTLKDLVAVLNIIVNQSIKLIGKTIVETFLFRTHKTLLAHFPELHLFKVRHSPEIELYELSENRSVKDEELIATATWIRMLIKECAKYEIKFETFDIEYATHSYYDALKYSGFYDYYHTCDDFIIHH